MDDAKTVFLYDGECGFCSRSVNFLLDHSETQNINFAAIQSDYAKSVFHQHGLEPNLKSSYLSHAGKLYGDSSAVLHAFALCRFPVKVMGLLLIIPPFLRNWVYRKIAKNRYAISKRIGNSCRIPNEEERKRFIA